MLLAACYSQASAADVAVPFEAVYQVYIDGKPRMESKISLVRQGDQWLMSNDGKGTRGLARMLKAKSSERSRGTFKGDVFQPLEYSQQSKIMGNEDHWTASFDWAESKIVTHHENGESLLETAPGTVDPLSLTLALRYRLIHGLTDFSINIVDEEEVDQQNFLAGKSEDLETPLGCFKAVSLTRIRENSKRYSSGWYAESLDFMPVKLLHGKQGGKEFEMRITRLVVDGQTISGSGTCLN